MLLRQVYCRERYEIKATGGRGALEIKREAIVFEYFTKEMCVTDVYYDCK